MDADDVTLADHAIHNPKGWHSRGYLPHRDHPGLLQAITYRLANSLPADALNRIESELVSLPPARQDSERRVRIDNWLDAGHGSCLLRHGTAAMCIVETWKRFDGERYDLVAWVVMPNQVHVLIRVYEKQSLGKIVQSWKSFTARWIGKMELEGRGNDGCGAGLRGPEGSGCGTTGIVSSATRLISRRRSTISTRTP